MSASTELREASPGQPYDKIIIEIAKKYKSVRVALLAEDKFSMPAKESDDGDQSEDYPEKSILADSSQYIKISALPSGIELAINVASADDGGCIVVEGRVISLEALNSLKLSFALERDANGILRTVDDILEASMWGIRSSSCQSIQNQIAGVISEAYDSSALIAPAGSWTVAQDLRLMQAVPSFGWPDNKRRVASILSAMTGEESPSLQINPPVVASHLKSLLSLLRGETLKQTKALPFSNAILRTMARYGTPHLLYSSIREAGFAGRRPEFEAYLMSWEGFLRECGSFPGLDEQRLRKFILEMLDQVENSSGGDDDKPIDSGLLFGLTVKSVRDSICKRETMHLIRTLLACQDDTALTAALRQKVMPTGTAVPPYARDRSMPVWWTTAHDVKLLKLTCLHGLHNWKKILAADSQTINIGDLQDSLSIIEAPLDFVIPLRENGQEWVLALTPKVAEKRLAHMLKVVDPFTQVMTLPQSPRRSVSVSAPAKTSKSAKRVKPPTTASSFNWTSIQMPSTKRESVPSNFNISTPLPDRSSAVMVMNQTTIAASTTNRVVDLSQAPGKPAFGANVEESPMMDADDCVLIQSSEDSPSTSDVVFVDDKKPGTTAASLPDKALDQHLLSTTAISAPSPSTHDKGVRVVAQSTAPDAVVVEKPASSAIKSSLPVATAVKKRKAEESKATAKKHVPASKSILSFFTKTPSTAPKSPIKLGHEST